LLTQLPTRRTGAAALIGQCTSIAAHLLVIGLLLLAGRQAWKVRPVNTRGGSPSTVLYWTSAAGAAPAQPHRQVTEKIPTPKHALKNPPKPPEQQKPTQTASAGNSATPSLLAGTGNGSEDATPAFPVYSPSPEVADRSLLPQSDENVVVDVNVSAQGEVLDEKLIHGLGNGLDKAILEIVKSWKFHPATVDGNAVASVAELVFPLNKRYRG
jgi:TonB family protein